MGYRIPYHKMYFRNIDYPVVYLFYSKPDSKNSTKCIKWAKENIRGGFSVSYDYDWNCLYGKYITRFCFVHESDAILFKLRYS